MWLHFAYLFIFTSIVKSDEIQLKLMNGTEIKDSSYCDKRTCIIKCCPEGYIVHCITELKAECLAIEKGEDRGIERILKEIKSKDKDLRTEIILVKQNNEVLNMSYYYAPMKLLENGYIEMSEMSGYIWPRYQYCVDFEQYKSKSGKTMIELRYRIIPPPAKPEDTTKPLFAAIGMLISSFFLLLVVLVYLLIPGVLEGFAGLLLVSYVTAMMLCFLLRAVMHIGKINNIMDKDCPFLTPVTYYSILTIFFWSNVLSYDLWQYTGNLKPRSDFSSRNKLTSEEKKKYLKYCLYACGGPLLITATVVVLKIQEWYDPKLDPPIFTCFLRGDAYMLLVHLPVGLMTAVNCILFIRTAYYMWFVKAGITHSTNSRNNKSDRNRFFLYLKLLIIMGLYWFLELLPNYSLVPYIIINLHFMLIGIAIFFILTWKRQIYSKFYNKYVARKKVYKQTPNSNDFEISISKKSQNTEEQSLEETL